MRYLFLFRSVILALLHCTTGTTLKIDKFILVINRDITVFWPKLETKFPVGVKKHDFQLGLLRPWTLSIALPD